MKTIKEIKEDLREIKYYYARKKSMDASFVDIGENRVTENIERYNNIVKTASPKLYDLYVLLYIKAHTQTSIADEMGYARNYIYLLNRELINFIFNEINKGELKDETNV